MSKAWRDKNAAENPKPKKLFIAAIARRKKEGLTLTPEETAKYEEWRATRRESHRKWKENNEGYYRDYKRKRKAENAVAVGQ